MYPFEGREEKQLAAVAAAARRNGGVLTAEQMAPLLDPPEYKSAAGRHIPYHAASCCWCFGSSCVAGKCLDVL